MDGKTFDKLSGSSELVKETPFYFLEAQVGIPLTYHTTEAAEISSLVVVIFRILIDIDELFKDKTKRLG